MEKSNLYLTSILGIAAIVVMVLLVMTVAPINSWNSDQTGLALRAVNARTVNYYCVNTTGIINRSCNIHNGVGMQYLNCSQTRWFFWGQCKIISCNDGYNITGTARMGYKCSNYTCPTIAAPAVGFCENGTIVSGFKDRNGCQLPPRCFSNQSMTPRCIDFDGSKYYTKGVVIFGTRFNMSKYSDTCVNNVTLTENICLNNTPSTVTFDCPNGCKNSACVKSCPQINATPLGWCENGTIIPASINNRTGCQVGPRCVQNRSVVCAGGNEQTCDITNGIGAQFRTCNGTVMSSWSDCKIKSCNPGYNISGNAATGFTCAPIIVVNTCTDTDGGSDYYTLGFATGVQASTPDVGVVTLSDYCDENTMTLTERYCGIDGLLYVTHFTCINGCGNSACLPDPVNLAPMNYIFMNDSLVYNGKTVKIVGYSEDNVTISVNDLSDAFREGETKTVNGINISVNTLYLWDGAVTYGPDYQRSDYLELNVTNPETLETANVQFRVLGESQIVFNKNFTYLGGNSDISSAIITVDSEAGTLAINRPKTIHLLQVEMLNLSIVETGTKTISYDGAVNATISLP